MNRAFGLSRAVSWGVCFALGLVACGTKNEQPREERKLPIPAVVSSIQASRAELVREADELAAAAAHVAPKEALPRLLRASELRTLAYESEGRKADLLEAIEILADASSMEEPNACDAKLAHAELAGHFSGDLKKSYLEARSVRNKTKGAECIARAEAFLSSLSAHAPSAAELRALEAEDPSANEHQPIVLPEVLAKELNVPSKVSSIEPYVAEHNARVVISLDHPTRFQVGVLEGTKSQGPRLFVDIDKASYEGPLVVEQKGLVERLRVGKSEGGLRVVFDLVRPAHHRVFYLPEPFRLIVDLSEEAASEKPLSREVRRIVLDPGHGGNDPGAIGPSGLREKDVTLDVAHRAAPLLAREAMVSTLLTRDVDAYVSLDERAARANAFHADLFISIHMNSSENPTSRGVMTFVLDSSRDTAAAQVAARENSSSAAAAAELANSLSRIESGERRSASNHFADLLQRAAGASLRQRWADIEDHGVRKAGFYVLAGAAMPAVLFEGSFISHPVEEKRLNSDSYRQSLADAIVNAVRAYREGH